MPGVVAFGVPLWILARERRLGVIQPGGLLVLALGVVGLLWCVRDFLVSGKGTLAPWDPPRELVVGGLYRFSRNPMYLSVLLVLLGWAVTSGLAVLYAYVAALAVAFHVRVVLGEEPWLARTHGAQWDAYARAVPRWLRWPSRNHGTTQPRF